MQEDFGSDWGGFWASVGTFLRDVCIRKKQGYRKPRVTSDF